MKDAKEKIKSFESFVTDHRIFVKDCGYKDEERMVRDAIVFGCKQTKVREKCIDLPDTLTLEKTKTRELMPFNRNSIASETLETDTQINGTQIEKTRVVN